MDAVEEKVEKGSGSVCKDLDICLADQIWAHAKTAETALELKSGQAYIVIGNLLERCGLFESPEGQRALDYFSDEQKVDEDFLPWGRAPVASLEPMRVFCVICIEQDKSTVTHIFSTAEKAQEFCAGDAARSHVVYDYIIDVPERMEGGRLE